MFSPVFHGARARGTQLLAAITAKLSAAVSRSMGVCSNSTVSQSKPTRAISDAAMLSGKVNQVPTLGWPRVSLARARLCFISKKAKDRVLQPGKEGNRASLIQAA